MDTTLIGQAMNAKAGAVLVTSEDQIYYMDGINAWNDSLLEKTLEVTGTVREEQFIPESNPSPSGAVQQGSKGKQMVVRNPSWKLIHSSGG